MSLVLNLIQKDIKNESNFENILTKINYKDLDEDGNGIPDRSTRGFYYERLWDLCIKLGLTDLTNIKSSHVFGNSNKDTINYHENSWSNYSFESYLNEPVRSGNSGGYSDITFLNKNEENEDLYFISVKYFKDEKKIDSYDIPKLCALQQKHQDPKRKVHIYLFVNDKKKAINNFERQNLSSNILIEFVNRTGKYENIYDSSDLHKYYFKLRQLLEQYNYFATSKDIDNFEKYYLGDIKPPFIPRFHQKLFINKINRLITHEKKNGVLVGAIPRSGKSYIMAGSILEYVKEYVKRNPDGKKLNFLMITPAPNETFSEYTNIFRNHIDFKNNNINCKVFRGKVNSDSLNKDKHNVIIISKQKLGWADSGKEGGEKIELIKKKIDETFKEIKKSIELMYLDEAHFGMSTEKSMQIFKIIESFGKKIPKVYVTATYNKPLKIYGIEEDCKLTWDVNDINIMKNLNESSINDNPIKQRFGKEIYEDALEWRGDKSGKDILKNLKDMYLIYPKPHLITSLWHSEKLKIEKSKIKDSEYGFDMSKLFMTKDGSFENRDQIYEMLRYYFGKPEKTMDYNDQDFYKSKGIIPRIKSMCSGESRTMQEKHMTSQLWFLPVGSNGVINDKIIALLEVLLNPEFKKLDYHYYTYVDGKKGLDPSGYVTYMEDSHNIKSEIENLEDNIRKGKNGVRGNNLIILTGNRLQLGISLRNVDIVVMWNSIESTDAIFQMLFRSMTEVNITGCDDGGFCPRKKWGFMVDLNPQRSMTNVSLFSENINYAKQGSDKSKVYRQIIDLIDIDGDIINDVDNKDEIVNDLFNKLYESWDRDVENIKRITENFSYSPSFIDTIEKQLRMIKLSEKSRKIIVEESEEKIDSGKKKETISQKEKDKIQKEINAVKEIPIDKIAAELVAELISLLNIFTLYLDGNSKCILLNKNDKNKNVDIMSDISKLRDYIFSNVNEKSIFLKILNGRLGLDENEEFSDYVIDKIIKSISDLKDISHMEKIIYSQKKQYYGIKDPDKLLEDINNNLAPKDKERKEKGEVFTPIYVVKEMLDKLPSDVWSNPYLKWLDPAVGIGNFPVIVYIKLMEGLHNYKDEKLDLTDEEVRRKHILEKMIFMVEVSEKSIFILNKVFCGKDGGGQYQLNIFHGSFVDGSNFADINKPDPVYNPTFQFDIIMGNPPYNQGGVGKGGGVFWKKFVDKSLFILNDNGYLTMIHPLGWRKPYVIGDKDSASKILHTMNQLGKLIYLNISDVKIKHFPKVDYYVFHKNKSDKSTIIDNTFSGLKNKSVIDINNLVYIPNYVDVDSIKIINKLNNKQGDKLKCIRDQYFKPNAEMKERTSGIPHAWFYDVGKQDYNIIYAQESEITGKGDNKLWNSPFGERSRNDDRKNPKVIMTYKAGNKPCKLYAKYYETEIGLESNLMYMPVNDKSTGNTIETFLNSKLIQFMLKITQYSESPNHTNEYKILNLITYPDKYLKNDDEIYDYYEIDKSQRELIENIVDGNLFDFDKYIREFVVKINSMSLEIYKSPDNQTNLYDFVIKDLENDKDHLRTLSEPDLKRNIKNRIDKIKEYKIKKEREQKQKLKEEKQKQKEEKQKQIQKQKEEKQKQIQKQKEEKQKQIQKQKEEKQKLKEEKQKVKTISKYKTPVQSEFKQPVETDPKYINKYNECIKKDGYLWNIHTKRCVKDTKANRKKLTLKK